MATSVTTPLTMSELAPAFTTQQKYDCIQREIAIRRRIYPGRVQTGRMSVGKALQEIDCLRAIADDYRQQLARERLL